MKNILLILATALFTLACNNNNQTAEPRKNTDLFLENLKGRVQHIEEASYKADSTSIGEMDSCCISISEFDENGNIIKYYTKDNEDAIKDEYHFSHGDNLQKKWVKMRGGKQNGFLSIQLIKDGKYGNAQSYDSLGNMDAYYTDITNNEYGIVTGWKKYNTDSILQSSYSGVFDKNIHVSSTYTDSTGRVVGTYNSVVDEKGNQIEFTSSEVEADSTINKVTTYQYDIYDDYGNWTQRTEYDDKGKPTKIVKRTITYYKQD